MSKEVSLIVLNYNGKSILEKYLPSIIKAAQHNNKKNEIILVDNNSKDDSIQYVKENFPIVKILALKKNKVCAGFNEGVKLAKNDIVILLNNDMEAKEDFIDYLIPHFEDKNVFAVAPFCDWKKGGIGPTYPISEFIFGFFRTVGSTDYGNPNIKVKDSIRVLGTGSGAFDRKKYLELGGFDEIYLPAYFEDIALGYKARKRGWEVLFEPKSMMHHEEHATINDIFKRQKRSWMQNKNRFIFIWIYVTEPKLFFSHIITLPFVLILGTITRGPIFLFSFFSALKLLPEIIKRRKDEKSEAKISDSEVCKITNTKITYFNMKLIKDRLFKLFKRVNSRKLFYFSPNHHSDKIQ